MKIVLKGLPSEDVKQLTQWLNKNRIIEIEVIDSADLIPPAPYVEIEAEDFDRHSLSTLESLYNLIEHYSKHLVGRKFGIKLKLEYSQS